MDGRSKNGGSRPGSGRKTNAAIEELREVMEEAWPRHRRVRIIKRAVAAAYRGDMAAFRTLMAYGYGTPVNGDDTARQEAAEDAIENLLTQLEEGLPPSMWRECEKVLDITPDSEAPSAK